MNETTARQITLIQAFDAADSPLWTREDGQWATRLATQTAPADATPQQLLAERARHALERLRPRDPQVSRWLSRAGWRWTWLLAALGVGFGLGLLADLIGRSRHIDLLAPSLWAIVAWNLAIYAVLALGTLRQANRAPGWFRRLLAAWWERGVGQGPVREAAARWAALSEPLTGSRTAVLVHAAAAALGAGMVAGLYLRGLVFDFRAAWESTFLEPAMVQTVLAALLTPAQLLTGLSLPDAAAFEAMRLTPASPTPASPANVWIHLYAATLALVVILPRMLLALVNFLRASVLALRMNLPVEAGAVGRFARWHRGGLAPQVQVLPYAQTPGAQAALGLRDLLAAELGADVVLRMADLTAVGDEDAASARAGHAGAVLRVALVDLGATPELEHHGRFLRALAGAQPAAPLLLLLDEGAYRLRFGTLPGRLEERRQAWRQFAQAQDCRVAIINLDRPEQTEGAQSLQQALAP